MAFESRSQANGPTPKWLAAASDIRFLSHSGDNQTVLAFEAPRLGEAASDMYEQQEFWPTRPKPDDTGFDLLGDVILDITANQSNSERFDSQLLRKVERFKNGLNGTFQRLAISGNRIPAHAPVVIDKNVLKQAASLTRSTPKPEQVRIVGTLDMIRLSTNAFAVKLNSGEDVLGILTEGNLSEARNLVGQGILVMGKAIYRPSGKLLRIDAAELVRASEHDQFFSKMPKPKNDKFDLNEIFRQQKHKRGIAAIYGKWPGDETDEEILAALKEMD